MIYLSLREASRETGLSMDYLRKGCKDGSIAHIRAGVKYLVYMPPLLENPKGKDGATDAE